MADFDIAVAKVIRREGGEAVTNDPKDPGGLTKYGISKRNHPTVDIESLTLDQAKAIYLGEYWKDTWCGRIDSQIKAELVFDAAVNLGVNKAVRLAQEASGAVVDGLMGKNTLAAIQSLYDDDFMTSFSMARIRHYVAICKNNKDLKKFFFGWVVRALDI